MGPGKRERATGLVTLIDRLAGRRVAVIGDILADKFIYGQVARVSREAPVLILRYDATQVVPGGAGNAANNVAALGGIAVAVGVAGRDEAGRRLTAAFHRGVDTRGVVRAAGYRTPTKTRILAGGIHSAKQQVVRIDREGGEPIGRAVRRSFERAAFGRGRPLRRPARVRLRHRSHDPGTRHAASDGRFPKVSARPGTDLDRLAIRAAALS